MKRSDWKRRGMALLALALADCSKGDPSNVTAAPVTEMNVMGDNIASVALPTLQTPTPHYQDYEGDRYFYITAVSDEDKTKGKAVGTVVQYRYLGELGGRLTLQQVTEAGYAIGRLECSRDCRIMKFTVGGSVSRVPFDTSSIAGAAMEDAINGFLQPSKRTPIAAVSPTENDTEEAEQPENGN